MGEIKRILGLAGVIAVFCSAIAQQSQKGDSETVGFAPPLPKFVTPTNSIHTKGQVVNLKGGGKVTLEYLFHRHKDEYVQWHPSGQRSARNPDDHLPFSNADFIKLGCVVSVTGLPDQETQFSLGVSSASVLGSNGGSSEKGLRRVSFMLSNPTSKTGSISVGVPSGKVRTWYSGKLNSNFTEPSGDRTLMFHVPKELVGKDLSFIATDDAGETHNCRTYEPHRTQRNSESRTIVLSRVPTKIKSMEVRCRDFVWVTFDNVHLTRKV